MCITAFKQNEFGNNGHVQASDFISSVSLVYTRGWSRWDFALDHKNMICPWKKEVLLDHRNITCSWTKKHCFRLEYECCGVPVSNETIKRKLLDWFYFCSQRKFNHFMNHAIFARPSCENLHISSCTCLTCINSLLNHFSLSLCINWICE